MIKLVSDYSSTLVNGGEEMTNKTGDNLRPNAAVSEIHRVEERVRSSRRWYISSMLTVGISTIAFFALVGWVPRSFQRPFLPLITFFPLLIYFILLYVRKSHPPTSGRELTNLEMRLGSIFSLLLLTAVAIDFFLLKPYQGTVWAAFTGILPSLPCFYGVWKVSRK
jgi:hypothetical protein